MPSWRRACARSIPQRAASVVLRTRARRDGQRRDRGEVIYMREGMGIATGVDMAKLVSAKQEISRLIGGPPVSRVAAALTAKRRTNRV
jgi:hypothetical protein